MLKVLGHTQYFGRRDTLEYCENLPILVLPQYTGGSMPAQYNTFTAHRAHDTERLLFVIAACMYQLYCGETLIGWFE